MWLSDRPGRTPAGMFLLPPESQAHTHCRAGLPGLPAGAGRRCFLQSFLCGLGQGAWVSVLRGFAQEAGPAACQGRPGRTLNGRPPVFVRTAAAEALRPHVLSFSVSTKLFVCCGLRWEGGSHGAELGLLRCVWVLRSCAQKTYKLTFYAMNGFPRCTDSWKPGPAASAGDGAQTPQG